ncbi:unnamed protein product [Protopolystoma xenopodis]|uniref:Uncharacterized protein n=1 Tax=Protopolystoma xenopodis TaxID=117903 RepID=A0A3S5C7I7_9PLAT|nr:unnamed protein product [Protopolystoma xenopodis]
MIEYTIRDDIALDGISTDLDPAEKVRIPSVAQHLLAVTMSSGWGSACASAFVFLVYSPTRDRCVKTSSRDWLEKQFSTHSHELVTAPMHLSTSAWAGVEQSGERNPRVIVETLSGTVVVSARSEVFVAAISRWFDCVGVPGGAGARQTTCRPGLRLPPSSQTQTLVPPRRVWEAEKVRRNE